MNFDFLFQPVEALDAWLTGLFAGAPLLAALGIAAALGLRHASDPDHLVAVTSLVAAEDGDSRKAAQLGAWWGLGHAGVLLVIGLPLIFFKSASAELAGGRGREGRGRGHPRPGGPGDLQVGPGRLPGRRALTPRLARACAGTCAAPGSTGT